MAIEFNCTHCDKTLKTSDEKAGRQAKCPGCGGLIEVPPIEGQIVDLSSPVTEATSDPDTAPSILLLPDTMGPCPACAEQIPSSSIRCQYCGEVFVMDRSGSRRPNGRREIRPFPPGEVLADAWRIYTEQIGLLIGSFLAMGVLSVITAIVGWTPFVIANLLFDRDEWVGAAIAAIIGVICMIGATAFSFYIQSGYLLLQLKVAREQPAEFSDLFSGSRFFFRMLLNSIIYGLIVSGGVMLCVIPGVLFALIFWPYGHVLVDEDRPGLNCLSRAKELTEGNWGSLFIMFVVAGASILAGYCACGIGLIFAIPYVNVLYAVTYDRMSCQSDLNASEAN